MVQLDGEATPIRLRPENLLCRPEFNPETFDDDLPSWCRAAGEIVVRWEPGRASSQDATASLEARAAEAMLAEGVSAASMAEHLPEPVMAALERAEKGALLSITAPHDPDLANELESLIFCEGIDHVDGEWNTDQLSEHGARYIIAVSWADRSSYNQPKAPPCLDALAPYYSTLRAVSQLVARYNAKLTHVQQEGDWPSRCNPGR